MNIGSCSRGRERMTKFKVASGLILTALLMMWVFNPLPPLMPKQNPVITARTKATMEEKRENRRTIREYSQALGYTSREAKCLDTLWSIESRFDHLARPRNLQGKPRSTAYGIAQLLGERSSRPELQVLHGIRYIQHRYRGSACRALAWHGRHHWY